ncbi:MAG: CZB domain-containing protein [Acidimicrobiales bacterium]
MLHDDELLNVLKSAVTAHGRWRFKLRTAANGGTPIDPETASRDDVCDIGKWLYGPGAQLYSNLLEYQDVVEAHATFHSVAGNCAAAIRTSGSRSLTAIFEAQSEFSRASAHLIDSLLAWELFET